jgi:hypothetical protein
MTNRLGAISQASLVMIIRRVPVRSLSSRSDSPVVGTVDDLYNAKTSARPGFESSLDDQRKFKGPDIDGMAVIAGNVTGKWTKRSV